MESGGVGTLLILDDSASIRREVVRILSEGGSFHRFLEAGDGAEGLKVLGGPEKVDVIACDVNMPIMDGLNFLRMVKADPVLALIPVVMVTTESEVSQVVRAFDIGANDYINKPFNPAILRARLHNMLRIRQLQDELRQQKEAMETMAVTDPLTGISNRRAFLTAIQDEYSRTSRYGTALSLMMVDLDHFKKVNDTHGHPRGDAVLSEIARLLLKVVRKVDVVARYGGEEFMVIMPQTDCGGGALAGERLRLEVQNHHFEGLAGPGSLTVSVGLSTYVQGMDLDVYELLDDADKALYRAKKEGRNRVVVSTQCKRYLKEARRAGQPGAGERGKGKGGPE